MSVTGNVVNFFVAVAMAHDVSPLSAPIPAAPTSITAVASTEARKY